jgi:hypothetical protein
MQTPDQRGRRKAEGKLDRADARRRREGGRGRSRFSAQDTCGPVRFPHIKADPTRSLDPLPADISGFEAFYEARRERLRAKLTELLGGRVPVADISNIPEGERFALKRRLDHQKAFPRLNF